MTIPTDIPERIEIPAAWIGPDMAAHVERWRWSLSPDELDELERTAGRFLSTYGGLEQITAARFAPPTLEPKLHRLRETLIHGIGFEWIRGIHPRSPPLARDARSSPAPQHPTRAARDRHPRRRSRRVP